MVFFVFTYKGISEKVLLRGLKLEGSTVEKNELAPKAEITPRPGRGLPGGFLFLCNVLV